MTVVDVHNWGILLARDDPRQHNMMLLTLRDDVVEWLALYNITSVPSYWEFDTEMSAHPDFGKYLRKHWLLELPDEYAVMFKLRFHP